MSVQNPLYTEGLHFPLKSKDEPDLLFEFLSLMLRLHPQALRVWCITD